MGQGHTLANLQLRLKQLAAAFLAAQWRHSQTNRQRSMMTPEVHDYIRSSVLCWLATVDAQGMPNVSPKEVFVAQGRSRILLANIASPTTTRNIAANPHVCLSFVDVFVRKGYKLRGTARVLGREDPHFALYLAPLERRLEGQHPIHSVINVRVESVEPMVAPSYLLKPGTTEQAQVQVALNAYGVKWRGDTP